MTKSNSVHFTKENYDILKSSYEKWWDGTLKRPITPIVIYGNPSEKSSKCAGLEFSTAWDMSIPVTDFIENFDANLDSLRFYGDAYPHLNTMAFGAGAVAAFLGCTPIGTPYTVWFKSPDENIPIEQLHFEYDPENIYFRRVLNLYEAAMEKWDGNCVIGTTDLGGILDILASFRGSENLLFDLYDSPDEVIRCVYEIQTAWFKYHDAIIDMMKGTQGYTHWYSIYSDKPSYILQSDFSYMVSPDMFNKFIAPELASSSAKLKNAVYHLDGIGEIPHLDTILQIDSIKGIQWVPGDGEPSLKNWDELLLKILNSGKKLLSYTQNSDGACSS